jgi:hypothetical protein
LPPIYFPIDLRFAPPTVLCENKSARAWLLQLCRIQAGSRVDSDGAAWEPLLSVACEAVAFRLARVAQAGGDAIDSRGDGAIDGV